MGSQESTLKLAREETVIKEKTRAMKRCDNKHLTT